MNDILSINGNAFFEDYADNIINRSYATYFVRMAADIKNWKLFKDDILVVDKGKQNEVSVGELFIGIVNQEFKVMMQGVDCIYRFPNVVEKRPVVSWGKITHGIHTV
ncbi:hypothetical protein MY04_05940 (plasmid) [Flammeovirga sp. MY04]|uniref:hypothetical protein n=1 Tax=Flammeovirga sp. MY04 TaxID=1191459 RepID=UPI0008060C4F|nr:hypothetical protein [Flammeovirga sp. MY04]ANQ52921.1 hypothetical protein MY04_05940 [Flammeovirga sp. MY04]